MSKFESFVFESYDFNTDAKLLSLHYGFDESIHFTETYHFDFEFSEYDPTVLDRACQLLFFIAGVSYYKAFMAPNIRIKSGVIDTTTASFLSKTYQKGLGEFFYVNKLDPGTLIPFSANAEEVTPVRNTGSGEMVGLGGGKDSLLSLEILKQQSSLVTWSVGHREQLSPLVDRIGAPHLWVERNWDRKLLELNSTEAYNGHIPISAIFACVGTVLAVLSGKRDVVVSNEQSANEKTLEYQGYEINHQYSKSQEFEQDFQTLLEHHFGESIRYYSLLRPFSELRICELFAAHGFKQYKDVFSSCNRAFTHDSHRMYWCGKCPKCAFVYLALSSFVSQNELEALFGDNLLLNPDLDLTYRQLLGIEGDKPLECVGEIRECRAAMSKIQEQLPSLKEKYIFELPDSYDYSTPMAHEIPKDIWPIVEKFL